MITGSAHPDVPLGLLELGPSLGAGGQGSVFKVLNRPREVFKSYYRPVSYPDTLTMLVNFPDSLDAADHDSLLRQTAWPSARVVKHRQVVGFLMKEVPAQFFGQTLAGPKLRELQYLLYPPKPLWGEMVPLDTEGRLEVVQAFVALVRILHEHSLVIGDISQRNLLWCPGFPAQICLIDCDSPTRVGTPSALPHTHTPDWHDPHMPATGPDLDTDRYKVALVVGRVLSANAYASPDRPWAPLPDIPEKISDHVQKCFAAAGGPYGSRPDAAEWARALRGRGTRPLGPLPPVRQQPKPLRMAELDGRRERRKISLPPPDKSSDQS